MPTAPQWWTLGELASAALQPIKKLYGPLNRTHHEGKDHLDLENSLDSVDYILVDLENTQPKNLELLGNHPFKTLVFVGETQSKLSFDIVEAMQHLGDRGEYIKISRSGKNALDFHIAYYIGRLSVESPLSSFHIISKDQGFAPLIEHLKTKKIKASLHKDIAEIPALQMSSAISDEEKMEAILARLAGLGSARPRKDTTLRSSMKSWFSDELDEITIDKIITDLSKDGRVEIKKDGTLIYNFSQKDVTEAPSLQMSSNASDEEKMNAIVKRLAGLGNARPRKDTTLRSSMKSWFSGELDEITIDKAIADLSRDGRLVIREDGTLTYNLPHKDPAKIPALQMSSNISDEEKMNAIVKRLAGLGNARPRKDTTLRSSMKSWFSGELDETTIDKVITDLSRDGRLVIREDGTLTYNLPHKPIAKIPTLQMSSNISDEEKMNAIVKRLAGLGNARPRKDTTLRNSMKSWFSGELDEITIDKVITDLSRDGRLVVKEDGTLTYNLPHKDPAKIPALQMSSNISDEEKMNAIVKRLAGLGNARPRKDTTLRSSMKSWFSGELDETTIDKVITDLSRDGRLVVKEDGTLTYNLPRSATSRNLNR